MPTLACEQCRHAHGPCAPVNPGVKSQPQPASSPAQPAAHKGVALLDFYVAVFIGFLGFGNPQGQNPNSPRTRAWPCCAAWCNRQCLEAPAATRALIDGSLPWCTAATSAVSPWWFSCSSGQPACECQSFTSLDQRLGVPEP